MIRALCRPLRLLFVLGLLTVNMPAFAYTTPQTLREDCLAAEKKLTGAETSPDDALRAARCTGYLSGLADGYDIGDYLADKVGTRLNAFCLPRGEARLPLRLVRAVLAQLDRLPPDARVNTPTLVAGAFSRAFPCAEKP